VKHIELEIDKRVRNIGIEKNKENTNFIQNLESVMNYIKSDSLYGDMITLNYYSQQSYVAQAFIDEMVNVENELYNKWNLVGNVDIDYDDNEKISVISILNENLINKFNIAKNMEEINNKNIMNNCKNEIIKYFDEKLDEYAKEYKISDDTLQNLKKDAENMLEKGLNKVIGKIFNNDLRNELKKLYNNLEDSYNKENFINMFDIAKQIAQNMSNKTTIYRDKKLFDCLRIEMEKVQMVRNKLKEGKSGTLSEMEENIIVHFDKEQMEKIEEDFENANSISKSDILLARLSTETDIFREVLKHLEH